MADQILNDLSFFGPELALTITLLVAIVADLIFRKSSTIVAGIALVGIVVSGALVLAEGGVHASIFSNMIAVDGFAYFFKLVIALTAVLIVCFSLGSVELNAGGRKVGEYYALIVALTTAFSPTIRLSVDTISPRSRPFSMTTPLNMNFPSISDPSSIRVV